MILNGMTDDTDLNAPLIDKERLAQIESSILALEQEVAKKLKWQVNGTMPIVTR